MLRLELNAKSFTAEAQRRRGAEDTQRKTGFLCVDFLCASAPLR